jgi:hypothetical protein
MSFTDIGIDGHCTNSDAPACQAIWKWDGDTVLPIFESVNRTGNHAAVSGNWLRGPAPKPSPPPPPRPFDIQFAPQCHRVVSAHQVVSLAIKDIEHRPGQLLAQAVDGFVHHTQRDFCQHWLSSFISHTYRKAGIIPWGIEFTLRCYRNVKLFSGHGHDQIYRSRLELAVLKAGVGIFAKLVFLWLIGVYTHEDIGRITLKDGNLDLGDGSF